MSNILGGLRAKALLPMATALALRAEMSLIIAREALVTGAAGEEFLALASAVVIGSMVIVFPLFSKLSKFLY